MGEVRPRRAGLRRESRAAASRRQRASGDEELPPPSTARTKRDSGDGLDVDQGARLPRGVDPDVRLRRLPWQGVAGHGEAREGTGRCFPRRRPAAPLLGPLDATTATTSTSSPASWSTGWSAGLIPFWPYKLRVRVRVALVDVVAPRAPAPARPDSGSRSALSLAPVGLFPMDPSA